MRQAETARAFDMIEDHIGAERTLLFRRLIEE